MTNLRTRFSLAAASGALVALSGVGAADTIFRTDGKPLEGVEIVKESLTEVSYKSGKDRETIPTAKVVEIEYETLPKSIDEAEDLLRNDDVEGALAVLQDYVEATAEKGDRRAEWGPAYAMRRLVEVRNSVGDFAGVAKAAERLIDAMPDSRHVPFAYLTKADAHAQLKDAAKAKATLEGLLAVADEKGLSQRWKLAAQLEMARLDKKGEDLRKELGRIAGEAGEFPTVKARAELAQAETYIQGKEYPAAKKLLQDIEKSGVADETTLAGVHTGLGDCLYQQGVELYASGKQQEAEAMLTEALLNYMRVVVSYPDQAAYAAKSMFYAGRAFDQFQDEESKARAQRMYASVMRRYQGSGWADEARGFR